MYSSTSLLGFSEERSNYHNVFIANKSFKVTKFLGEDTVITVKEIETLNNFTVTADVHSSPKAFGVGNDTQSHVMCGDYTYKGTQTKFYEAFKNFNHQLAVMALGNHDLHTEVDVRQIAQRADNFYQRIGKCGFFVLHTMGNAGPNYNNDVRVNKSIQFLRDNLNTSDEHKFIVVHQPIYSTGKFGSYPLLTKQIETILDEFSGIRAVFTGHDHVFAAFKRK